MWGPAWSTDLQGRHSEAELTTILDMTNPANLILASNATNISNTTYLSNANTTNNATVEVDPLVAIARSVKSEPFMFTCTRASDCWGACTGHHPDTLRKPGVRICVFPDQGSGSGRYGANPKFTHYANPWKNYTGHIELECTSDEDCFGRCEMGSQQRQCRLKSPKVIIGANPDGGEVVEIFGTNFGPTEDTWDEVFLDKVTYGPAVNTNWFVAQNCQVVVSSKMISCVSRPGVGKDLFWVVTVKGQYSQVRIATGPSSYYRMPKLLSIKHDSLSKIIEDRRVGLHIRLDGLNTTFSYAVDQVVAQTHGSNKTVTARGLVTKVKSQSSIEIFVTDGMFLENRDVSVERTAVGVIVSASVNATATYFSVSHNVDMYEGRSHMRRCTLGHGTHGRICGCRCISIAESCNPVYFPTYNTAVEPMELIPPTEVFNCVPDNLERTGTTIGRLIAHGPTAGMYKNEDDKMVDYTFTMKGVNFGFVSAKLLEASVHVIFDRRDVRVCCNDPKVPGASGDFLERDVERRAGGREAVYDILKRWPLPQGWGTGKTLRVEARTLAPTLVKSNSFDFMYDPPLITNVHVSPWSSSDQDAGLFRLTIEGANFGATFCKCRRVFVTPLPKPADPNPKRIECQVYKPQGNPAQIPSPMDEYSCVVQQLQNEDISSHFQQIVKYRAFKGNVSVCTGTGQKERCHKFAFDSKSPVLQSVFLPNTKGLVPQMQLPGSLDRDWSYEAEPNKCKTVGPPTNISSEIKYDCGPYPTKGIPLALAVPGLEFGQILEHLEMRVGKKYKADILGGAPRGHNRMTPPDSSESPFTDIDFQPHSVSFDRLSRLWSAPIPVCGGDANNTGCAGVDLQTAMSVEKRCCRFSSISGENIDISSVEPRSVTSLYSKGFKTKDALGEDATMNVVFLSIPPGQGAGVPLIATLYGKSSRSSPESCRLKITYMPPTISAGVHEKKTALAAIPGPNGVPFCWSIPNIKDPTVPGHAPALRIFEGTEMTTDERIVNFIEIDAAFDEGGLGIRHAMQIVSDNHMYDTGSMYHDVKVVKRRKNDKPAYTDDQLTQVLNTDGALRSQLRSDARLLLKEILFRFRNRAEDIAPCMRVPTRGMLAQLQGHDFGFFGRVTMQDSAAKRAGLQAAFGVHGYQSVEADDEVCPETVDEDKLYQQNSRGCLCKTQNQYDIASMAQHKNTWCYQCGNHTAAGQKFIGMGGSCHSKRSLNDAAGLVVEERELLTPVPRGWDHDSVVFDIPSGIGKNHRLKISVSGRDDITLPFDYEPPRITSISPRVAETRGNHLVSIKGTNF